MHHFAAHHEPAQQTTLSLRATQYRSRKRKRDEDAEEPPISPHQDVPAPLANSNTQSQTSLTPQEADQLRVAGLLPGDAFETPPRPFPHAPARASRDGNFNYGKLQKELAGLRPPLYAANSKAKSNPISGKSERLALRETHLGVLTTILHHCLLEGDYQRAGTAWGMILRTQIAGRRVDVRNHGRWGIGAEILLHRNAPKDITQSKSVLGSAQVHSNEPPTYKPFYTEEGFMLARDYYERIIVQYQNRKLHPNRVDELAFYPAMFSLWIYEVCQRSKSTQDAIKEKEVEEASKIKDRLDEKVTSPPFDKRGELLEIRGMIGLWLGDLLLGETSGHGDWTPEPNPLDPNTSSSIEGIIRRKMARKEFEHALDFLHRAQALGRRVEQSIRDAETKLDIFAGMSTETE
ncbi:hypothetical protein BCR34DRAFT_487176 [Clohesyomyces aquaticus]|uniref:Transcription initiation factor Rrn11 n=1 Tax=Clohesyomyces aquaticus TaxID=1231657 RepID=A0A1Y1ZGY5_9PLEO|nr:hypothetical protein BCR34DRAFT_487176 [Clohesyomyces aquaticus]